MLIESSNYNTFARKSKGKNVFLYAYVPVDPHSHSTVISFMKASRAFKVTLFSSIQYRALRILCSLAWTVTSLVISAPS